MLNLKVGLGMPTGPYLNLKAAAAADAKGFDSMWVADHMGFDRFEYEPLTMLAAYSVVTSRIALGIGVLVMPLRQPTVLAKTCATVDHLSGGRLILGVGPGGEFPQSFPACGVDHARRGPLTDEAMSIVRKLWTEGHVTHHSDCYNFDDVTIQPRSVRPGGIPIWVGGRSDASVRRAGRLGDGFMPMYVVPERYKEDWIKVEEQARAAGRDPSAITPGVLTFLGVGATHEAGRKLGMDFLREARGLAFRNMSEEQELRQAERYFILGTAAECLGRIRQYADAGVRHFIFRIISAADGVEEQVQRIGEEILPEMRRW